MVNDAGHSGAGERTECLWGGLVNCRADLRLLEGKVSAAGEDYRAKMQELSRQDKITMDMWHSLKKESNRQRRQSREDKKTNDAQMEEVLIRITRLEGNNPPNDMQYNDP